MNPQQPPGLGTASGLQIIHDDSICLVRKRLCAECRGVEVDADRGGHGSPEARSSTGLASQGIGPCTMR